jgi:AraC-like DNA-binding protein
LSQIPRPINRNPALRSIEAARQWIALNYDQPITIQQAAKIAGYSPSHFTKAFSELFGESPRDFLAKLRINKAIRILAGQSLPIQQIAIEVGFTSLPTFSNRFKALTGKTPSQFQRDAIQQTQANDRPTNPLIPSCISNNFKNHKPE